MKKTEMSQLSIEDIKYRVSKVAHQYDIKKILLFGSFFDGNPTENSDIDLLVSYGIDCKGLQCISFMQDLEASLGRKVDVLNVDFPPRFIQQNELTDERRVIYSGQK